MNIILTGFEPFNGSTKNPSERVIHYFPDHIFPDHTLIKQVLPVDYSKAVDMLQFLLKDTKPEIVIMLGEASSRPVVSLEKVAINWMDYRIADNSGTKVVDQFINEDGPAAYFSTLPVRKIFNQLHHNGIPVEISMSAGTYLCNQVFYSSLYFLDTMRLKNQCGFIHLPPLPEQVVEKQQSSPSMNLEMSLNAITLALQVCVQDYSEQELFTDRINDGK